MIVSARYILPETAVVVVLSNGSEAATSINLPPDTEIRRALREWLDAGNLPEPYTAPPVQPRPLTRRQFKLALLNLGIDEAQIEALLDALPAGRDRAVARIEWREALTFERDHPLIAQIGSALGLTTEQIDAAWQQAATI